MASLELLSADALRSTVVTFRNTMHAHASGINRLNVYPVPDGDTGTNMARTLDAVVAELDTAPVGLDETCDAISHGSLMGARGNSGVILSQILRGLASTLKRSGSSGQLAASGATVAAALAAASTAAYEAVLKPIEGTILTVVRSAADGAGAAAERGSSLSGVLRAARDAGRVALAGTPDLLPVLKDAGVVDAGGAGFMLLLDSALHVVDGEPLPQPSDDEPLTPQPSVAGKAVDMSELRYEVMYFLDLKDSSIGNLKQAWSKIGDSIVVVGGDGLWNCHIHTNDIGAAVELALDLGGRPRGIRVTDLLDEVADEHLRREASMTGGPSPFVGPSTALPHVTCAVVAVASGDGLVELFGNLGVQGVVTGGQTLNPSTAELLAAVEAVNANQVIVLPNNKNIIPVAEQLDALTSKRVIVVPSLSMPAALAALVVYDPEADGAANHAHMSAAIESVATGEVTRAVRDTSSPAGAIVTGDWIGLVRGDGIVAVSGSLEGAATALLDHLTVPGSEIVTIITGASTTPLQLAAIQSWLADERPDVEVEVHRGGQLLYPFLFGVE